MSDEQDPLAKFCGTARLFPLPNLVLFPQVIQPLHIFEPRYRAMTEDALASDRLIAMVLLQPGWEPDYAQAPAIYSVACLTRVVADQRLPDGRFNLLVRGLCRIRIDHEVPHAKAYRLARVDLLQDVEVASAATSRALRKRLGRLIPAWLSGQTAVLDQLKKLVRSDLTLGALGDILTFALPLDVAVKQELLEELNVARRIEHLVACLEAKAPPKAAAAAETKDRKFPPDFSPN
jgi:uncharacterized protein